MSDNGIKNNKLHEKPMFFHLFSFSKRMKSDFLGEAASYSAGQSQLNQFELKPALKSFLFCH